MLKIEGKKGRKSKILVNLSVEEINDELFKGATTFSRVSKQLVPGDQQ